MKNFIAKYFNRFYLACYIGLFGGYVAFKMGLDHIWPMVDEISRMNEYKCLSPHAFDFIILIVRCVGLLLCSMGILSFYFAFKLRLANKTAHLFFMLQTLMYGGRVILELIHPVSIPAPRPEVLYSLIIVDIIFFIPFLLSFKKRS